MLKHSPKLEKHLTIWSLESEALIEIYNQHQREIGWAFPLRVHLLLIYMVIIFILYFSFIEIINILIFLINDLDDVVEDSGDSNTKMLEKIINQNSEMNKKIDSLLARQKSIEDQFIRLEVGYEDKNADDEFNKVIIFKLYYYLLYYYYIINVLIYLDYH